MYQCTQLSHIYTITLPIKRVARTFWKTAAKVYQSTVFLGCARRGQRAVGDPSAMGLFVYV